MATSAYQPIGYSPNGQPLGASFTGPNGQQVNGSAYIPMGTPYYASAPLLQNQNTGATYSETATPTNEFAGYQDAEGGGFGSTIDPATGQPVVDDPNATGAAAGMLNGQPIGAGLTRAQATALQVGKDDATSLMNDPNMQQALSTASPAWWASLSPQMQAQMVGQGYTPPAAGSIPTTAQYLAANPGAQAPAPGSSPTAGTNAQYLASLGLPTTATQPQIDAAIAAQPADPAGGPVAPAAPANLNSTQAVPGGSGTVNIPGTPTYDPTLPMMNPTCVAPPPVSTPSIAAPTGPATFDPSNPAAPFLQNGGQMVDANGNPVAQPTTTPATTFTPYAPIGSASAGGSFVGYGSGGGMLA